MPYISKERRNAFPIGVFAFTHNIVNAGELNYVLTRIVMEYLKHRGGLSYLLLNEAVGVLECVKQEFYSRVVVPYEEQKCEENGDVY